jgi:MFS family permease
MTQADSSVASEKPPWRQAVRGNVLMMGLVSLFTDFSSEMINPLLAIFILGLAPDSIAGDAARLAWAAIWVGRMEGLAEATASLLKIVSGRLSDRLGKRKALVLVGYGLSSVCRPLMALAGAAWQVTGLKFADRVGKGIRTSPRDALIGDSVAPEVRGLAFSFHRSMDHVGAVLGPLVAVCVLYALLGRLLWASGPAAGGARTGPETMRGLRWLFGIALVPGVAAMVCLFWKVREMAPARRGRPEGPHGLWREMPRRFCAFVAIVALFSLGNSSDMFLLLYGWAKFGMNLVEIIGLWMLLHVSKIAFSLPGGALSDRLGRRPVIVAGWLVYALVYLGMAWITTAWQFWALFVVYGFYYGMSEGAEKALVADFVPSQHRGTAFGIYHGAVGLAALPASLIFGELWGLIGPRWAFGTGAALAGAAAVLLIVLLSVSPREEGASQVPGPRT